MNALQRDLAALVRRTEAADLPLAERDPYRQKFHLMPPVGWMNDPNGLCWYRGSYHVFYQYGPFDCTGGVKCWGHWSSPDLLHWTQQPVMLYPDETWDIHGVYSGSALVEDDALYLYYTGNVKHPGAGYDYIYSGRGHNTALAVSRDGVRAEENILLLENSDYPAGLSCHVRDPKVWKQDGKYYMVLGARTTDDRGEILVMESADKRTWKHINTITTPEPFGYMWECPDLFELNGQTFVCTSPQGVSRAGNRYQNVYSCGYFPLYGDFRGEYTLGGYQELDVGFDYYAPQSFVAPDGRRIVLGWMGMPDADYTNPTVEHGWQHCMSVPRELHWNGERLTAWPVRELEELRGEKQETRFDGTASLPLAKCADICVRNAGQALRIELAGGAAMEYVHGVLRLSLSEAAGCGRTERAAEVDTLRGLRILADASSLEIFINGGEQVMTSRWYPAGGGNIAFSGAGSAEVYDMKPMQFDYQEGK